MKKKLIILTAVLCLFITGCSKVYEKTGEKSYRVINNVQGLSFDMYEPFLENCLFSTGILNTDQMNNGSTYVYRNDSTDYMAYNSKSFGMVAQKITSLELKGQKKSYIKSALSNLYFLNSSVTSKASAISYKTKSSKGSVKYITTKPIEMGVAPNILSYQNYYGYLAYIECSNGDAYAIFIGTITPIDEASDDVKKMLQHVVSSAYMTDTNTVSVSAIETPSESAGLVEVSAEPITSVEESPVESIEPVKEEPEATIEEPTETTGKVGDSLRVSAYNGTTKESSVIVTLKSVNKKADDFVKEYETNYFAPQEGCHFELAEYVLSNTETDYDTVDFSVVGLDYNNLVYYGLKYSTRTYELNVGEKTYVYYEIPNGCTEYVLEVGGIERKGYFYEE